MARHQQTLYVHLAQQHALDLRRYRGPSRGGWLESLLTLFGL